MNKIIEVENKEIAIRNEHGDIAIIPKKYAIEVADMIKDGCNNCINEFVSKLPKYEDYAEDGTLIPEGDEFKKDLICKQDNATVNIPIVTAEMEIQKANFEKRKAEEKAELARQLLEEDKSRKYVISGVNFTPKEREYEMKRRSSNIVEDKYQPMDDYLKDLAINAGIDIATEFIPPLMAVRAANRVKNISNVAEKAELARQLLEEDKNK